MMDVTMLLKDLIAIPSVNPLGGDGIPQEFTGENKINEYIIELMKRMGVDPIMQKTAYPGRENVGGMIYKGEGYKTILLQCHTDTVGVNGDMALFSPVERGGKIYGRGACDDKGPLAAMLCAVAEASRNSAKVGGNIIVMGVADEEYTFKGSLALVAEAPTRGADIGIVGEPTRSRIVNGFKGVARWDISTCGKSFHSSEPHNGVNAIYKMARIVSLIEEYQEGLKGTADLPLGAETISVGKIRGGTSVNIVPDECVIEIDRRLTRRTSPGDAMNDLRRFLAGRIGVDFSFSELKDAQNAALIDENHPAVKMLKRLAARNGFDDTAMQVAFGSDAFRMNAAGIPTVLWGPGDIAVAHTQDEHVEIEQLNKAQAFYYGIMTASR